MRIPKTLRVEKLLAQFRCGRILFRIAHIGVSCGGSWLFAGRLPGSRPAGRASPGLAPTPTGIACLWWLTALAGVSLALLLLPLAPALALGLGPQRLASGRSCPRGSWRLKKLLQKQCLQLRAEAGEAAKASSASASTASTAAARGTAGSTARRGASKASSNAQRASGGLLLALAVDLRPGRVAGDGAGDGHP